MSAVSLESARAYLDQLDLGYIVKAMCAPGYALPQWVEEEARYCEQLYKRFLLLSKMHPQESFVPTRQIDEFWHNHILYTKQYTADCLKIFGHYFHHAPASMEEDNSWLIEQFLKTKRYYLQAFGEEL